MLPHIRPPSRRFFGFSYIVLAVPLVGLAALGLAACQGCRSSPVGAPAAPGPSADLGPPTLRLYFASDLAGALEPCGCTKDQLGGLDHFAAWVKASPPKAPVALEAAAGPLFFMDDRLTGDRADQDRIKAETIARVLGELDFAAFAPGINDWDDGPAGFEKLARSSRGAPLVSERAEGTAVVREVGGLKVGFVGFGQSAAARAVPDATVEEAIRRGVARAKSEGANVLVALTAVGRGEAKRIADAVPELTAVVVGSVRTLGDANTTGAQGEQVGSVLIVQPANHLQSVGVLDLYVREAVSPGKVVSFADATGLDRARRRAELAQRIDDLHVKIAAWERDPSVAPRDVGARREELATLEAERQELDRRPPPAQGSYFRYMVQEIRESLGKDSAIEATMRGYYRAVNDHNRVLFADRQPPPANATQATYVGVEVCSNCHAEARAVWDRTSHAHAYASLSSQYKEFNLECVTCHVTGYE